MFDPIDYLKISHAVLAFQGMGFKCLEVPWIVPLDVAGLTTPRTALPLQVYALGFGSNQELGSLIGSAEQGFLEIYDALADNQKYVSASPCFRDESELKAGLTQRQFFKVELFVKAPSNPETMVRELLVNAKMLMGTWERKLVEVVTEEGIDLHVNGIEVGSYGVRSIPGKGAWAYGTGLALPRFDYARSQLGTP